jgi:hypothetical protein
MAIDPKDLRRFAARGGRPAAAASPARPVQPAPQAPRLPEAPPGYAYVLHQGIPMLAPLAPAAAPAYHYAPPRAAPAALGAAGNPGNVIPFRRHQNARLVRPLSKDGAIQKDPWDAWMETVPDITRSPGASPMVAMASELEQEGPLSPAQGPASPDNPFGNRTLNLAPASLKS